MIGSSCCRPCTVDCESFRILKRREQSKTETRPSRTLWRAENSKPTFGAVAAYLRLRKKYEISELRSEAIKLLSHWYPSTLQKWDETRDCRPQDEDEYCLDFKVANLAQEMGLLFILPACLYAICDRDDFTSILDGVAVDHSTGKRLKLEAETRERALRGFVALHTDHHPTIFKCLLAGPEAFQSCTSGSILGCQEVRKAVFTGFFDDGAPPLVRALGKWYDGHTGGCGLCDGCRKDGRKLFDESRQEIWQSLPMTFRLPPWEELLAD